MILYKADKVSEEPFESFLSRYQVELGTSIKGCNFIFDGFNLLYYKCPKINLNHDGSYTDSRDWKKS